MGKIIWLASYPKSGNTWLRVFLHNFLRNPPEGYDINRITDFCASDADVEWYLPEIGWPPGNWTEEEVGRARRKGHEAITRTFPDSVFVKTHNALTVDRFGPLITLELTAGAIYIVRNPLDVVVSYRHHLGATVDGAIRVLNSPTAETLKTPSNVPQQLRSWSEHVASWTARPHPGLHVIRYEDMLSEPERTFGGVANFLGVPPPRERLLRAIERSGFEELQGREEVHGFKERSEHQKRFFREGRAGQWRDVLTQAQIDRIVQAHRPTMQRFGYFPLDS
jgi:sulfotransferase family protein